MKRCYVIHHARRTQQEMTIIHFINTIIHRTRTTITLSNHQNLRALLKNIKTQFRKPHNSKSQ